ncbi:SH3 domain-containing protein 19-like isoform X1 [Acanthochromis polyacanthus]|uniref:SH3 domain-containing protein 19-like isoform X1 n=1 Tax=Acanthochromis polyacanthus TaxID=80966 RepID=UPI0022343A1E|nr:SH3 domain-containing protein 19-like isoform X1 [Acanthochromis polyacanthus]
MSSSTGRQKVEPNKPEQPRTAERRRRAVRTQAAISGSDGVCGRSCSGREEENHVPAVIEHRHTGRKHTDTDMAEARAEQDDDNMPRDAREPVVRRPPSSSGGRPDRRKPEHRHSQGPLSSIRAAIKRTSARSTSLSETPRERDRDRERDRERRRPEITILSAEPLASPSWFPGASGGFPPPPPPAAQIWGPTIPPSIQPPPSYEEVIREKSQEQVPVPSSSSSLSSPRPVSTTTIATQTDPRSSAADPHDSPVRRPVRPARPPLPHPPKSSHLDDITVAVSQSALSSAESDAVEPGSCDLLSDFCSPLTSCSAAQTDQWDHPSERPKPRPRSKLGIQPISSEVKVQTLVKLREDGLATLASRASTDGSNQDVTQGKYLQELLDAFSSDDWGFPDHRSDSSSLGQSDNEEEEEEEEDMATLRARIQAFEQQQAAEGDTQTVDGFAKRPEPRPRPRLQGQPSKPGPPAIAPKPKHYPHGPKPSSKVFWEDGGPTAEPREDTTETPSADRTSGPPAEPKPGPGSEPQTCRMPNKPSISPKPPSVPESPSPAPVPAPRPPPPKLSSSLSDSRVPPRPPVAPRASVGAPPPERITADGHTTPTLPPRPSVEVGGGETPAGTEATQNTTNQTVKSGSVRPFVPTKPTSLNSARRSSAPNLAPKPTGPSPTQPDPVKPSAAPVPAPKPPGPTKPPTPNQNQTPAPALRKVQTKAETSSSPTSSEPPLPPRPSSVKLLPLRPPPIKSIPGRPPPPTVSSAAASSSNQIPPPKAAPTSSVSPANQIPPSHTAAPHSAAVTANQMQRAPKKGPPLPPRPKPGHPLFNSYMKQEVLIVLDDPSPSEPQTVSSPVISPPQCLLDLEPQPEPGLDQDQSKPALEGLSDSQSILPAEQKELPEPATVSGPRCVAVFDYEGEEEDELTFCQGDVIALLQLIGQEWGRGQIHGRIGIFPLSFTEVIEPLPQPSPGETKPASTETGPMESSAAPNTSEAPQSEREQTEQWAVALFDFPGQTAEDLSFHKGALIQVMEHVDAEWCRGRLEGREGLYPAAFTQPCPAQPITGQQAAVKAEAKALFDFTAESEDELTLKVGDVITQVESVDDQWIFGVIGGKRGIVPKNYISFL